MDTPTSQWHNFIIHTEKEHANRRRRVKYNKVDFNLLIVAITANGHTRHFAIPASVLPKENDSIHFTYNTPDDICWSPAFISQYVEEINCQPEVTKIAPNLPYFPHTPPFYLSGNTDVEEEEDDIYKKRKKAIRNWVIVIICIIIFLYFLGITDSNSGLTQSGAQVCVEHYLKTRYLNDPDSYQPEEWSPVVKSNEQNNTFTIMHTYRARNGFGGYVRETQIFELDSKGNIINHYQL